MKCLFALAFTLFAIASEPAFSQEPRYLLDVEGATPGKEIVISRPPNGLFPIRVILNVAPPAQAAGQPAATPKAVQVTMSQFAGDRGSFAVQILACDSRKAAQSLDFTSSAVQTICLWIPPLQIGGDDVPVCRGPRLLRRANPGVRLPEGGSVPGFHIVRRADNLSLDSASSGRWTVYRQHAVLFGGCQAAGQAVRHHSPPGRFDCAADSGAAGHAPASGTFCKGQEFRLLA